jgi:predicted O-methyltransferase YrrM
MLPRNRVEQGEIDIADLVLWSKRERAEVYQNYLQQMIGDTAFHKDAAFCLWHPNEVIDEDYPVVRSEEISRLAEIMNIPVLDLLDRCRNCEEIELLDFMREPGRMQIGLRKLIARTLKPGSKMIEIGSFAGQSTEMFLDAVGDSGLVVAIDPWDEFLGFNMSKVENVFNRLLKHPAMFKIKARSDWAVVPDYDYDMVYIDGDHSYDSVIHDINFAREHVKENGWIAGHDFNQEKHPDVVRAVKECFSDFQTFEDQSWLASAFKETRSLSCVQNSH